jgi:FkbM family methyltransferase
VFHRILQGVPGLLSLVECLRETPGSWLFRRPTSEWLGDGALVSQLPRSYRMFARYCSAQREDPVGAELLLRFIIWLRRVAGADSALRLEIQGKSAFVDLSDPRFLAIPGELTAGLPRVLKTFLRPGDTFVDVGSNHGTFAITAAPLVGPSGLVVAIEPQTRLAELIRRSLELYDARFVVHNVACGDSAGTARLYVPDATSGSGGLYPSCSAVSRHRATIVPLARLDDLLLPERLPGRVFVKLDIEGSEAGCLAGARNFLASARPAILMEINSTALEAAGSSTAALAALLHECGYDRYLGGRDLDREHPLTGRITSLNIVALHGSR